MGEGNTSYVSFGKKNQMKTVREKGGKCAREFKDKVEKKCKRR
jgi:hypothetical protein